MQAKCHKDRLQEPPNVLVHVPGKPAGKRIGVVKFYEMGYYSTSADNENWTSNDVDDYIKERNSLNGLSEEVAESALGGSMFGWHVPAAKEAIEWYKAFSLKGDNVENIRSEN